MAIATVIVGDWSHDGHGQTETFQVQYPDNLKYDLNQYFKDAVKHGVPNIQSQVTDYEDSELTSEFVDDLIKVFGESWVEKNLDLRDDSGKIWISTDEYLKIWIKTVEHGIYLNNESGSLSEVIGQQRYEIGGYGLFWN